MYLDHVDRAILRYLLQYGGWHNTNQIADGTRIAWATAHDHLLRMNRLGYVRAYRRRSIVLWHVNR